MQRLFGKPTMAVRVPETSVRWDAGTCRAAATFASLNAGVR